MNPSNPQTVLVTGASSGIGVDLAHQFAKRGHTLILLARRKSRLEKLAEELQNQYNIRTFVLEQDLLADDALDRIDAFLAQNHLGVDILVNNAGFGLRGYFYQLPQSQQMDMISLNIQVLTLLTHHFLGTMIEKRQGGILNVASVAAFQPGPKMSVYFATKAFVLFFTEALHEEVKSYGIKVSALCPGPTESEFSVVANMHGTRLFKHGVMKSSKVAQLGVDGFFKNKAVVVTGVKNQLLAFANRFVPRFLVRKIVYFLQK